MSKEFNVNKIREDFPILDRTINGNKLAYLDNASSSQKPRKVIQSLVDYYENYKYQKDAISKGIDIVKEHNGVLLSDVVGLGKSIIASTIAHNLKLSCLSFNF